MYEDRREQLKGKNKFLYQKTQETKGKFKLRLGMLTDQKESKLSDRKKIEGRRKQYFENLYGRDKRMTDTFEADSYEEEPVILKREVKTALRVLGKITRNSNNYFKP